MRLLKKAPQELFHISCQSRVILLIKNGDRGSGDPPGNGRHYPHSSGGGCGGPHGIPGGGNTGLPDNHYGGY